VIWFTYGCVSHNQIIEKILSQDAPKVKVLRRFSRFSFPLAPKAETELSTQFPSDRITL
jgi:hypothetical protein